MLSVNRSAKFIRALLLAERDDQRVVGSDGRIQAAELEPRRMTPRPGAAQHESTVTLSAANDCGKRATGLP
jgi:predicted fused transcriptional regulator/phosphomethylpyrimidine kinase